MCSQGPLRVIEKRNSFKKAELGAYHGNFVSAVAGKSYNICPAEFHHGSGSVITIHFPICFFLVGFLIVFTLPYSTILYWVQ